MNTRTRTRSAGLALALALALGTVAATVTHPALAADAPAKADPALAHAKALLKRAILFDGHNDLPWVVREKFGGAPDVRKYDLRTHVSGQTDIARLRAGGLGAQFWSVYIQGEAGGNYARSQLEQIATARRIIAAYPDVFELSSTADDIVRAHARGRIGGMLGMEGGYAIENSLGPLRAYYDLGVRYMTLTHNTHTDWADSALQIPPKHDGLTDFGRDVVHEMNRLGMLIDLSHTSSKTMLDALATSTSPVIWSHAAARALCETPRNVPDEVLDKVHANGGVVMVTFVAGFVSNDAAKIMMPAIIEFNLRARELKTQAERDELRSKMFENVKMPKVTVAQVADHIDYIAKRVGYDNVGIGGDFDGNDQWPEGLSDVSMYPNLFAELIRRGWSDANLTKLAGGNVLRVLRENEANAKRLQAEGG